MNIREAFLNVGLSWPPNYDEVDAYRKFIIEKATKQMEEYHKLMDMGNEYV